VVDFLNVIGVPWPYIDEDVVLQFAQVVREFAQAVENTHRDATEAVSRIADAHQGGSTQAMTSGWSRMSTQHVYQIVDACHVLAHALDGAAGYIVAQKLEATGVLIGMAAAFVADQAAAVATAGIAEAAVPLIIEGAERVVKSLVMDLEQHVIGRVIEAGAKPLFAKVEAAMAGLDWGSSGGRASTDGGQGFSIDPTAVRVHTSVLRRHAATVRAHGDKFQAAVADLGF
jgi:hypothetical protein